MSTRAYLTIVDEQKNIQMAAFCPSSAYPSCLGIQILDAISNCAYPEFIAEIQADYPDEKDTVKDIRRDWYVRSAKNKDDYFFDYAYELNGAKQELTVFHLGDKALTIPYDQIPLYRFIFENTDKLYYPLCLDERTMTLKKDLYKEIRTMVKNGTDQEGFQSVIDKNHSVLYLDNHRLKDSWDTNSGSFNKYVQGSAGEKLKFHVSEQFGSYRLYIQTPFIRASIPHPPIKSAAAAEKLLAEYVRQRPEDLRATAKLLKECEKFVENIKSIYYHDSESLEDRADKAQEAKLEMLEKLNDAKSSHQIFGNERDLLQREITELCANRYRQAYLRAEEQAQKTPLSDAIQNAAERSETAARATSQTREPEPEIS